MSKQAFAVIGTFLIGVAATVAVETPAAPTPTRQFSLVEIRQSPRSQEAEVRVARYYLASGSGAIARVDRVAQRGEIAAAAPYQGEARALGYSQEGIFMIPSPLGTPPMIAARPLGVFNAKADGMLVAETGGRVIRVSQSGSVEEELPEGWAESLSPGLSQDYPILRMGSSLNYVLANDDRIVQADLSGVSPVTRSIPLSDLRVRDSRGAEWYLSKSLGLEVRGSTAWLHAELSNTLKSAIFVFDLKSGALKKTVFLPGMHTDAALLGSVAREMRVQLKLGSNYQELNAQGTVVFSLPKAFAVERLRKALGSDATGRVSLRSLD